MNRRIGYNPNTRPAAFRSLFAMPCLRSLVGLLLAGLPAFAAEPKPSAADLEHFENKVRPFLVEHCQKCHGADAKKSPRGGLKMLSRADLLAGGDTGPAIVPGDPGKSLLITSLKYHDESLKMPPVGKRPDAEIAELEKWIKVGAPWPEATANATDKPKNGTLFTEEQKKFWAFQPVKAPNIPHPLGTFANEVDAFILAKLEAKGMTLSQPADKRTLLRRVTFDLIGLPPTPEELEAFEKDTSLQAFAKVVDRLLASPHYGERWGRHWLDVARYADSNGMDENTAFGNAWKYRDWVVKAFNNDMPYDRFVREQLAADLLPPLEDRKAQLDRLAALGFLSIGPKLLAEPDKQKMLIDIADEQLDTVGKAFIGLTLGCARCHDHKFDPIPARDYYSLLGIFTSTRTMQGLGTVAKAHERSLNGPDTPEVAAIRKKLETVRRDLRKLEQEFGKLPETEKEKRHEIHLKAEAKRKEIKDLEATIPANEFVLAVEEGTAAAYGTQPRNLFVQIRGNYTTAGEEAPAVFPRIMAGETQTPFVATTPNADDKPQPNKTRFGQKRDRSGRLELANWLTDPKHPLTARVFVNRVWRHHFGTGLVATPDNFGRLGDRPSHPQLLDWLANEFVANGWSVKQLHRTILLSQVYQQAGGTPKDADPDNKLLSYYPRRRLEAEAIRDSFLAVAGTLDRTLGGSLYTGANLEYVGGVKYDSLRRTLYLPVIRGKLFDFLQTFDFPDPAVTVGHRVSTVVAPQALYLMNNPFVQARAKEFAERMLKEKDPVDFAYRRALLRDATPAERSDAESFVNRYAQALEATEKDAAKRKLAAWTAFAQALFASSEFSFVE
jgi:mono/diheme cytochrome c family protein